MLFRLYNMLMGLAKESLQCDGEEAEPSSGTPTVVRGPELVDLGPDTDPEVLVLVDKLKELIKELPKSNLATLRYIIRHLRKSVTELNEENEASGLLNRPRRTHSSLILQQSSPFRIAELEEENKMSPSNLGIVFGPSLMRPRPTGATISLSSLVDYPHQARIVEAFIVFYSPIFQSKASQSSKTSRTDSTSTQQVNFSVWAEV